MGRIRSEERYEGLGTPQARRFRPARLQECRTPTQAQGALFVYSRDDRKPAHYHGQLEWMLVDRGEATLRLGTTTWTLKPRTLVCVLPQRTHEIFAESDDFSASFIMIDPEFAARIYGRDKPGHLQSPFVDWLPGLARLLFTGPLVTLTDKEQAALSAEFETQRARQESGHPPLLVPLMRNLREALERHVPQDAEASIAERAAALIAGDPEITAAQLAKDLDISERWLVERLKEDLGVTPSELRARVRVTGFLALARSSNNLLAAGLAAGFGSYSQLYRVFSGKAGVNPKNYVRSDGRNRGAAVRRGSDPPEADTGATPEKKG